MAFYKRCISAAKHAELCNRRMADVEGMMGSILFNAKRFGESEPWFESVVAREDENVRPQIMLTSLRAYSKILMEKGKVEHATQMVQRAIAFERNHPGATP